MCTNCDHVIAAPAKRNKYNATRTTGNDGIKRDSKFESSIADELLVRKLAGDIKDYDNQFRVDIPLYDKDGIQRLTIHHKIDFRVHNNDGTFELLEAKGIETDDYKWRLKMLLNFWLPFNKDYTYRVRKSR